LKKHILQGLKFLSFFSLGIFIFWLVYKDQDFDRIKSILAHDVNYSWIAFSVFLGLLSHISRSIRWNLIIEPLGHNPRVLNTFLAVMVGYIMNLALPRMGEISKCGVMSRYEKISFTKLIGTVVVERLIDIIMLLLLLLLTIFTQFGQLLKFLDNNPEVKQKLEKVIYSPILIGGGIVFLLIIWMLRHKIQKSALMLRLMDYFHKFVEGLRSISKMKKVGAFVFHSFFIWFLYYAMMVTVFYAFDFSSNLPLLAGLTVFVLGSFGMLAPVQGGIGAWHFMVIQGLILYGISKADATVFALVAHGSQTVILIVFGLLSMLALPFVNERPSKIQGSAEIEIEQ
jgi:glycosyltransferase 2 family protein